VPTTRYHRDDALPETATASDEWSEAPAHAHLPLVVMLVLTQLSVGTFAAVAALAGFAPSLPDQTLRVGAVVAMASGLVAIGASVGHLGRPLQAWRAVVGFGHSWLSREIVVFGAFAPAAVAAATARLLAPRSDLSHLLGAVVSGVGLVAVACSVMIYAVTGRRFWRLDRTARSFAGTTAVCGLATATVIVVTTAAPDAAAGTARALALAVAAITAASLAGHAWLVRGAGPGDPVLDRSARLIRGPLAPTARARVALAVAGGVLAPLLLVALLAESEPPVAAVRTVAVLALVLVVRAELAARTLFFRALASPRMPGIPR
jgi:formate dehydrogenase iron-sulfur subunit